MHGTSSGLGPQDRVRRLHDSARVSELMMLNSNSLHLHELRVSIHTYSSWSTFGYRGWTLYDGSSRFETTTCTLLPQGIEVRADSRR